MAFIQVTKTLASTSKTALYTVPEGKEYVLMRERMRENGVATPSVSFSVNSNSAFRTLSSTNSSSHEIIVGPRHNDVYSAGTVIYATSTAANAIAEIMGIEIDAGSWSLITT